MIGQDPDVDFLNDSNEISAIGEGVLNLTNISDILAGGNKDTLLKTEAKGNGANAQKNKKRDHMYQFVEWNF